jgi:hypothetical protein
MASLRSTIIVLGVGIVLGCSDKGTRPTETSTSLGVDLNGQPVTLEQYRGQVVLTTFWVTWASWSRLQLRTLDSLKTGDSGAVAVIAVSVGESADSVARFLESNPVDLHITTDDGTAMRALTNSRAFPTSLVFTKDGERYADLRGYRGLQELLATVVAAHQQPGH